MTMETRTLGRTNLEVGVIGLGTEHLIESRANMDAVTDQFLNRVEAQTLSTPLTLTTSLLEIRQICGCKHVSDFSALPLKTNQLISATNGQVLN